MRKATTQINQSTPTSRMMRFVAVVLCIQVTFRSASGVQIDCKNTARGADYSGSLSVTKTGKTCLNWATHPTKKFLDAANPTKYFPEDNLEAAVNYCRNGDNASHGPWCYIDDVGDWEACDIPDCPRDDCKQTDRGVEYNGQLSETKTGKTCLNWADLTITRDFLNPVNKFKYFPERNSADAINYCRNADNTAGGPWCYVDAAGAWEICDVPDCPRVDCKIDRGVEYNGQLSETKTGKTCLNWADLTFKRDFLDPVNKFKYFPERNLADAVNYCRNPDNTAGGPWCYVDAAGAWEICDVPDCSGPETTEAIPDIGR